MHHIAISGSKNRTMKVINQPTVRVTKLNHRVRKQRSTNVIHTTIHPSDHVPIRNNNKHFFAVRLSDLGCIFDLFLFQ
jgi:hypothetical protein